MLNLPKATKLDSIANIVFRVTYVTAVIKEIEGNGKYKIKILGSEKIYPHVFANDPNIEYSVDDSVGVLWEYGCREKPIIVGKLRNIEFTEITGGVNSLGS